MAGVATHDLEYNSLVIRIAAYLRRRVRVPGIVMTSLLSAFAVAAQTSPPSPTTSPRAESSWIQELVPRAFQRNPRVEMTVVTEMTDAGRKLPAVSPESPAFYSLYSAGYRPFGERTGSKPLTAAEVESMLTLSLSKQGYRFAKAPQTPALLIIYFWGAHNSLDAGDSTWELRNLLDRAALVGGDKFATELGKVITDRTDVQTTTPRALGTGSDTSSMDLGAAAGMVQLNAVFDPVRLFMQRSAKNQFLIEQIIDDCYYVVASAYDYHSVAANRKQLLWRTRMTVNARSVSQAQAIPPLIAAAAPYFGRDMPEPETMLRRTLRGERVDVGSPTVVEDSAANPGTAQKQPSSPPK